MKNIKIKNQHIYLKIKIIIKNIYICIYYINYNCNFSCYICNINLIDAAEKKEGIENFQTAISHIY